MFMYVAMSIENHYLSTLLYFNFYYQIKIVDKNNHFPNHN